MEPVGEVSIDFQSIFNLADFHNSRPGNKIYVAYFMSFFMYQAFFFSS